jgi:hypothetical protein
MSRYDLETKQNMFSNMSNPMRWGLWFSVCITVYCIVGYYLFYNENPVGWFVTLVSSTWINTLAAIYMKLEMP